jgi:hypothetical protein
MVRAGGMITGCGIGSRSVVCKGFKMRHICEHHQTIETKMWERDKRNGKFRAEAKATSGICPITHAAKIELPALVGFDRGSWR